jgi:hypothetical protein
MAKKRFEGLAAAERLRVAIEKIIPLIPVDADASCKEELQHALRSAVKLLLERSEHEFRHAVRSLNNQSISKAEPEVAP